MGAKTVLGIGRGINGREFICSIEIVCKIYEISVVLLYSIKADALQVLRYAT